MVAATSSTRAMVTPALERLGIADYLDGLFTSSEIGDSKHQPTIFHAARKALGAPLSSTYVFEDSPYALITAKRAGFRTVGIYEAARTEDAATMEAEADLFLHTWEDAIRIPLKATPADKGRL